MKTKVTFKALRDGKIVYKTIPIEHNFSVIPSCEINNTTFPETSVDYQVIKYLDSIDKRDLMIKYDFDIIIDYWIKYKKPKRNEIQEFVEWCSPIFSEMPHLRKPLSAICYEMRGTLFGKNKSHSTKLNEALKTLEISYKVSNAIIGKIMNNVCASNKNEVIINKLE